MTKRKTPEQDIHKSIIQYLRWQYPHAAINHSANEGNRGGRAGKIDGARRKAMGVQAGWPDIEMLHEGQFWFFEVKAHGKYATRAQIYVSLSIRVNGGRWACVHSVDDVQAAIDSWGPGGMTMLD